MTLINTQPGEEVDEEVAPVAAPPEHEPGAARSEPTLATPVVPGKGTRRIEAIAGQVLLVFGVLLGGFLLFVFVFSGLSEGRAQAGLQRRFEKPLTGGSAAIAARIRYGTPVARVDIPAAGIHQIVVEGTTPAQLQRAPGHVAVTPLPGEVGNAVIAGHRIAFGGPFSGLSRLKSGAKIQVLTGQGHFTYVVSSHQVVAPSDVKPFQATRDNRLTLVTADNLGASKRLVIVAELRGHAKPFAPGRRTVLAAADGGLVGQSGNWGGLIFWSLVLLVVAAGSVLAYRKMPRWSSYLATTPVIVLVAWLIYQNLAGVLPATF